MAAWGRAVVAVALVILPGGLLIALAWALGRAVVDARRMAIAKSNRQHVSPREVWRELRVPSLRTALHGSSVTL